jgi:hypothetical protein
MQYPFSHGIDMPGLPKGFLNDKLFAEHDYQYTPDQFLMSR